MCISALQIAMWIYIKILLFFKQLQTNVAILFNVAMEG